MTHPLNCGTCLNKDDCDERSSQAVRDISERCGLACHSSALVPEGYIITEKLIDYMSTRVGMNKEIWDKLHSRPYNEQSIRQDAVEKAMDILEERLRAYYHGILSFTDAQYEIEILRKHIREQEVLL